MKTILCILSIIFFSILIFSPICRATPKKPQHLSTSTHQHPKPKKPQHLNTSTPQHLNTSTPQHLSTKSTDTLPSTNRLHATIDSFYALQAAAQLLEYRDSRKGEWLKFLPNIGITYTIDGKPRPGISLNSSLLYQARKSRQIRAAKRRSIIEANRLEAEKTKARLKELLLRYQLTEQELTAHQQLHQVEHQLFLIHQDEYNRLEIAPSDYLQAKRTYLLQQQSLHEKERRLEILKMEILLTAHNILEAK